MCYVREKDERYLSVEDLFGLNKSIRHFRLEQLTKTSIDQIKSGCFYLSSPLYTLREIPSQIIQTIIGNEYASAKHSVDDESKNTEKSSFFSEADISRSSRSEENESRTQGLIAFLGELLNLQLQQTISKIDHTTVSIDKTIFVSYSRTDWQGYVEPLVNRLRGEGFQIWIDQQLIEGGQDWLDEINQALDNCKIMILCVSPNALQSRWVKMEYRYFLDEEKALIPLVCKETKLPAELRPVQFLLYNNYDALLQRLQSMIM